MTINEFVQKVVELFQDFQWIYVLEFFLLYLVIYYVLKTCWRNNAKKVIAYYLFAFVALILVAVFARSNLGAICFVGVLLLGSSFLLSMFSTEIKRSIWRKPAVTPTEHNFAKVKVNIRAEECINEIIHAVQNLSKSDIGALIVLSKDNLPKEILQSGVTLNSNISSQLIEGIFIPKAPLHDGAMIINGDKIQAAGCFLPLTQKEFPKEFGTRHRAGIGVTETADVTTIIVSEETGIISTVKEGNITRFVNTDGLRSFLKEYYVKEFGGESKKS